ncbi:MAG: DegT/DnrJ/EryC1/StrS aminotransferase family protein [Candidatus Peregrinibacteria bacterium]
MSYLDEVCVEKASLCYNRGIANIPLMRGTFFRETETKGLLVDFIRRAERLSMGEQCEAFEQAFAAWQKRAFAVFVSSGSAANLVLLQSLLNLGTLKRGDRIGFSAITWATNVMPIIQLGLTPVPLDCEISSLNTSLRLLEERCEGLQAVFLTDVLGFCSDLDRIRDFCTQKNILLLEDACESLGSIHAGRLLGNFGLASTFSFFVGHHLSTIEGGMICTDDPALHRMLVMVRAHGWDRQLPVPEQKKLRKENGVSDFDALYTFYDLAFNARPTEIAGFLGNVQLPFLAEIVERREKHFLCFHKAVASRPDRYVPLEVSHLERISNFAMPVVCRSCSLRDETTRRFREAGVEIRPIVAGDITEQPFYRKYMPTAQCPQAKVIQTQGFYFPNHPDLTEEEVQVLCGLL